MHCFEDQGRKRHLGHPILVKLLLLPFCIHVGILVIFNISVDQPDLPESFIQTGIAQLFFFCPRSACVKAAILVCGFIS
jgi:hypothetical protein